MSVVASLYVLYLNGLEDRYVACSVLTNDICAEFVDLYITIVKSTSDNNKYTPNTTNIYYNSLRVYKVTYDIYIYIERSYDNTY
jgi:hypothetical protein